MTCPDFVMLPFTVVVDTREQAPYLFKEHSVRLPKRQGVSRRLPVVVPTISSGLETGDYSIEGLEDSCTIERKSFEDALGTFTAGRERFERELDRMAKLEYSAVLLEFQWERLLRIPKERKISTESMDGSITAWQQRFPNVQWIMRPNRAHAERAALRHLVRFWNDRLERKDRTKWTVTI